VELRNDGLLFCTLRIGFGAIGRTAVRIVHVAAERLRLSLGRPFFTALAVSPPSMGSGTDQRQRQGVSGWVRGLSLP
jgi:hypothetical protein